MATDGRSEVSAGRTDASPPAGAVLRTNVQALDRAVGLLNAIAEAGPHGVTLRALAERALLPASTARTLLASLVAHGLVAQTSRERRYLLGTRFFELNRRFTSQADLSVVAAPVLHDLWKRTEETIHLAVLHGAQRADIAVLVPATSHHRPDHGEVRRCRAHPAVPHRCRQSPLRRTAAA